MSEVSEHIPPTDQPGDESPDVVEVEQSAGRPVGVTILAILSLIAGVVYLPLAVIMFVALQNSEARDVFVEMGMPPAAVPLAFLTLGVVKIVAGVLMLLGRRRGWHLYIWLMGYAVLQNAHAAVVFGAVGEDYGLTVQELSQAVLKHIVRALISVWFLCYMLGVVPRGYFGIERKRRSVSALALAGLTYLVMVAGSAAFTAVRMLSE